MTNRNLDLKGSNYNGIVINGDHITNQTTVQKVNITLNTSEDEKKNQFQIFVRTLTGRTIKMYKKASDTIRSVKEEVYKEQAIPIQTIRLIFAGKELDDDRTLSHYNIEEGCTINMVMRLRGGQ